MGLFDGNSHLAVDHASPPSGDVATLAPIVRTRDGSVFADSRDVTAYFRRQHKNVIAAIRELNRSAQFRRLNFQPSTIKDLTGDSTSHVEMTKDGFTFLAFGFTGSAAGVFKEAYIRRFNEMEAELRSRQPSVATINVRDHGQLAAVAMQLIVFNKELEDRAVEAEAQVAVLEPKAQAHDRIADLGGTFCRTTAAKMLGVPPKTLMDWMMDHGWTYLRSGDVVASEPKAKAKMLVNKMEEGTTRHGVAWRRVNLQVTTKGLAALAKEFPPLLQIVKRADAA